MTQARMTPKCSVFIATSLDGYIARDDGSIDWLEQANASVPPGEDCGYRQFMSSVDTLVMGRNTFDLVLTFDAWPYGDTPVVVMTHRRVTPPGHVPPSVSFSSATPSELVESLGANGARHVYVDGGRTIQSFLAAGLIDEMTITVIPILLGSGRTLFGALERDVRLAHLSTTAYDFGFVQSRYRVLKSA